MSVFKTSPDFWMLGMAIVHTNRFSCTVCKRFGTRIVWSALIKIFFQVCTLENRRTQAKRLVILEYSEQPRDIMTGKD